LQVKPTGAEPRRRPDAGITRKKGYDNRFRRLSAGDLAHEKDHLDKAVAAFTKVGAKHGILGLKKDQIIAKYGM
jgi:hypothetical protein